MSPDDRLMVRLIASECRQLRDALIYDSSRVTIGGGGTHRIVIEIPAETGDRLVERLDYLATKLEGMK